MRLGDWETRRLGDWEIGRLRDWRLGDWVCCRIEKMDEFDNFNIYKKNYGVN
jgi:hypothetical protein